MTMNTDTYSEQSVTESLNGFETQTEQGLINLETKKRVGQYGYNEIEEKEETIWQRIFRHFWGPINLFLKSHYYTIKNRSLIT